jgi:hypothetical protein
MQIGLLPMILLIATVVGVVGIILYRTIWCRFQRKEQNNRRRDEVEFVGRDRRRRPDPITVRVEAKRSTRSRP